MLGEAARKSLALPGMTRNFGNPCEALVPSMRMSELKARPDRKVVLLATATITTDNLFSNGLFQNVFVLYRMFDAMGYEPVLVIHEKPESPEKLPPMIRGCRMLLTEEIILRPLPVVALIEIGMSIDPLLREFVKMLGGRLVKLYLGNILNIDIETPIYYPQMHFAHHVIEKIDRIWVSPHYGQHAEYAAFINHTLPPEKLEDMVAPYVWDPCFIQRDGTEPVPRWTPPSTGEHATLIIMEPNISFQKSSLVPLLAIERWYRSTGRAWKGKVVVINGDRLEATPHFQNSVRPRLALTADGRIEYTERKDILTTMRTWPSAIFVGNQMNNEFNYMTLELMWCGFPIVHNAATWGAFGYFYDGNNLATAAQQIDAAVNSHAERLEAYKAHARTLVWKHSPYNPEIHAAWERLLKV